MTADEKVLLIQLARLDPECAYPFRMFENSERPRSRVRVLMRRLARQGYVEYQRGLMDEDGNVAGAGYQITTAGLQLVEKTA